MDAARYADEVGEWTVRVGDELVGGMERKWLTADGTPKWPSSNGFNGTPSKTTLQPGTKIDRFGNAKGSFAAPEGTPYGQRSLPPGSENSPLHGYEAVKPIEVNTGTTAPWFGHPGGGIQYQLPLSIEDLLRQGYIREIIK